jgi:hypothetical protein
VGFDGQITFDRRLSAIRNALGKCGAYGLEAPTSSRMSRASSQRSGGRAVETDVRAVQHGVTAPSLPVERGLFDMTFGYAGHVRAPARGGSETHWQAALRLIRGRRVVLWLIAWLFMTHKPI